MTWKLKRPGKSAVEINNVLSFNRIASVAADGHGGIIVVMVSTTLHQKQ